MNWLIVGLTLTVVVAGTAYGYNDAGTQRQMPLMNGFMSMPTSSRGIMSPGFEPMDFGASPYGAAPAPDYEPTEATYSISEGIEELNEFLEGLYVTIQRRKMENTTVIIGLASAVGAAIQFVVTTFMSIFGVLSFLMLKDFLRKNGLTMF